MSKFVLTCAKFIVAAHCHVWAAGQTVPNWYMPSFSGRWSSDWEKVTINKKSCAYFLGPTITWFDGRYFRVRWIKGTHGGIDIPRYCYADLVVNVYGFRIQEDGHPVYLNQGQHDMYVNGMTFDATKSKTGVSYAIILTH